MKQPSLLKTPKTPSIPLKKLVTSSKLVAASSMANAAMYKNWAVRTYSNIGQTDKKFSGVTGANGNELAETWFAIDQTNSNNKLLRNHFEELKVLQATLGIYTYSLSEDRAQQLRYHRQLVEIGDEIKESAGKINEPLN